MTAKIYIADTDASGIPHQHLYLIYDPDGVPDSGDERILRGGQSSGFLSISLNLLYADSVDAINPSNSNDTYASRDTTELDLGGRDATTVWNEMVAYTGNQGTVTGFKSGSIVTTDIQYADSYGDPKDGTRVI